MKWIGSPVAEIWPFKIRHIMRVAFGTPVLEKRGRRGQRWYRSKERICFYGLYIATISLSLTNQPQYAIQCLRRLSQQATLGQNWERKGLSNVKVSLVTDRSGFWILEETRVDVFCCLSTMHERDRQTDHGRVTSIPIGEIACQQCRLIIIIIIIIHRSSH